MVTRDAAPVGVSTTRLYSIAKRSVDIVGALLGLLVGAPILAVAVLAIRLESGGPAIFRQVRLGQYGRPFTLYKLRGMYSDARERFPELYDYHFCAESGANLRFHLPRDPRVTRVGRYLRLTSVDELPNLWNVLKGEMSLVGPRPEIPEMLPYYGTTAAALLSVKPGVSSLAKVSGRDELTFTETLAYDIEYVTHRSLRVDLQILVRTVATLLRDGWVVA